MSYPQIRVNASLSLSGQRVETTEDMIRAYQDHIAKHGYGARTLFYTDEEMHSSKITQYSTLAHRLWAGQPSVLDVGCGYGKVTPFLPPCSYRGIDVVPEFVEEARRRNPGCDFQLSDVLDYEDQAEWVLLQGVLGTVPEPEKLLVRAWELATVGLIVDVIDADRHQGKLNRFDVGSCIRLLIHLGSRAVEVHPSQRFNWVILVAFRHGLWLMA